MHNILEGESYQFVRDPGDDSLVWVGIVLFCTAPLPSEFGSAQHVPAIPRQLNLHWCAIADSGTSLLQTHMFTCMDDAMENALGCRTGIRSNRYGNGTLAVAEGKSAKTWSKRSRWHESQLTLYEHLFPACLKYSPPWPITVRVEFFL